MMKRYLGIACFFLALAVLPLAEAGKKAPVNSKEALQNLQDFIGQWQDKNSREAVDWSWRFKEKDVWLSFEMKGNKQFKTGEIRYDLAAKKYKLTLIDSKNSKRVFDGGLVKDILVFERVNPTTQDTEQLKINTAADGDRLVYTMLTKPEGRTLFTKQFQTGYTREGVTFGSEPGSKQPECCVTGGLGTMQVSYNGQTFYVCCSGCRDAFNDNPAKIVMEYLAKKKKK